MKITNEKKTNFNLKRELLRIKRKPLKSELSLKHSKRVANSYIFCVLCSFENEMRKIQCNYIAIKIQNAIILMNPLLLLKRKQTC